MLINTILSFFVALYGVFFLFEGKCVFGWIFNNAPKGFELVKYARGGFFELVWVMAINMLVYLLVNAFTKEAKSSRMNQGLLSCLMSAIVIFGIVSFAKLYLYVDYFSYTPKRILAMWGAIVLVVGAILIIVSLFTAKLYARSWIVFVVVSYIIMCMIGTGLFLYEKFNKSAQGKHLYITEEIAREEKANRVKKLVNVLFEKENT